MPATKKANRKAIFLDRDGVINRAIIRDGRPYAPSSLAAFEILPGAGQAIESFRAAGFVVIVATNQPDVGAGKQKRSAVEEIHVYLLSQITIDDIKVCYHTEKDGCSCRKPKPGLLIEAAKTWGIDLKKSFMIGDRWRDIRAGQAAGCKTIWIETHYKGEKVEDPDEVCGSLLEASRLILGTERPGKNKK